MYILHPHCSAFLVTCATEWGSLSMPLNLPWWYIVVACYLVCVWLREEGRGVSDLAFGLGRYYVPGPPFPFCMCQKGTAPQSG